jgi:hypothetical protein
MNEKKTPDLTIRLGDIKEKDLTPYELFMRKIINAVLGVIDEGMSNKLLNIHGIQVR